MNTKTKDMLLIALFAALTAVGAFIRIPVPFIPFTLQFFFCAFAGLLLGAKAGMLSQLLYVAVGLAGIPVFTQGGGIGYVMQPSFGYLLGLIPAAYAIGAVIERQKKPTYFGISVSVLTGLIILYLIGVPYLYAIYNFILKDAKSIQWAVKVGFLTFIGGDIVKTVIVSFLAYRVMPIIKGQYGSD